MESLSFFERMNRWIRNSVTIKLLSMGILMLLLLIPALMIQSLIREREYTREAAINEVSDLWGRAQTVSGPVLMIPYHVYRVAEDDQLVETTQYAYFLPEDLAVEGTITPETRYRGIYEVAVYTTALAYAGHFTPPDFSDWDVAPEHILWDDASISIGITDMRGIIDNVALQWQGGSYDFRPGTETPDVVEAGISVRMPVGPQPPPSGRYDFTFNVNLNGSRGLQFVPLGKETRVQMNSPWADPSFFGAFLPDERTVAEDGFTARWRVLHLNRNYPQQWRGATANIGESAFGVNLLVPVDEYRKSMRAAKYAILVITLTFLTFFLAEVRYRKRAHPFQYILIGLALCLFYTLLLSLSEHIPFNGAYIVAGLVTIGTVTAYTRSVFKTQLLSVLTGLVLLVLYGFIFIILQLQDYALLVGSIGLFAALTLTMYLSRNIDWYAMGGGEEKDGREGE